MMSWIFISMLGLGVLLLLLSVVLFVVWRIPSLLEELSGKRGKRKHKKSDDFSASGASDGLTGNEYYKEMMLHKASLIDSSTGTQHEGHTNFGDSSSDVSTSEDVSNDDNDLAKLINNPNQVWGKKLEHSTEQEPVSEENKPVGTYQRNDKQDDLATEMLDDSQIGLKHKIFIIEEQSSLND